MKSEVITDDGSRFPRAYARGPQLNFDRRSGIDRREFSYTAHFPERRSEKDRRGKSDIVALRIIRAKATQKNRNIVVV
ncbi:MAG: hypothetical protein LJE66_15005 [Desulfobacterales bacterium]|jgi:hypothetical protein|nr:hypothetical protein [Desulfobacterales bacterium]